MQYLGNYQILRIDSNNEPRCINIIYLTLDKINSITHDNLS